MKKKIISLLVLLMIIANFIICNYVYAFDETSLSSSNNDLTSKNYTNTTGSEIKVNSNKVEIYQLDYGYTGYYGITMPSNYPTTFQLKVTGTDLKPAFKVVEGDDIIKVSSSGLIEANPKARVYYSSIKQYGYEYNYGDAVVRINIDGKYYYVNVTLKNYMKDDSDEIIDEFISKNITDNMSEYEKLLEVVMWIVDNYGYSTECSDFRSMVKNGAGDCVAHANLVTYVCNKIGLEANTRYAVNRNPNTDTVYDPMNNHHNATVIADGVIYKVDTSFGGNVFELREEEGGFCFVTGTDSEGTYAALLQYDGREDEVVIPSAYSGYPVKKILTGAFSNAYHKCKKITIPDTVEYIGNNAFSSSTETVYIPSSVKTIGSMANAKNLKNLTIDSNNPYFSYDDYIIYNKNKTEIVACLISKDTPLVIPNTITSIDENAFKNCNKITGGVTIPKSVKSIGDGAFDGTGITNIVIEDGCTASIGSRIGDSFYTLKMIRIPETVTSISNNITSSPTYLTIYGKSGSYAQNYAESNSIPFVNEETIGKYTIVNGMSSLIENQLGIDGNVTTTYDYDGTEKKPKVTVTYGSTVLKEGVDYKVTYPEDTINSNGGETKTITVTGIGKYTGTSTSTYTIEKVDTNFDFEVEDIFYGEKPNPVISEGFIGSKTPSFYYKNVDTGEYYYPDNQYSSKNILDAGQYQVEGRDSYVTLSNFNSSTVYKYFNVLPASNTLRVICDNVEYGGKPSPEVTINYSGGNITFYYKTQGASDSTYTTTVPTAKGKYTVKAISAATNNYKKGESTANFEIGVNVTNKEEVALPEEFEYKELSNGTLKLTKYIGARKNVIIPSTINGKTVTQLDREFIDEYSEDLSPDILQSTLVESVTIPATVKTIHNYTFSYATKLKEINVDASSPYFYSEDGVLYQKNGSYLTLYKYPIAKEGTVYTAPARVSVIYCYSIEKNEYIQEVNLPSTVRDLRVSAIGYDPNLKKINVYGKDTIFYENAVGRECPNLTMYVYENSRAQTFAEDNNIKYVIFEEKPISGISLDKTTLNLKKGETSALTAKITPTDTTDSKTITWTTSNSSVARVSGGKITAVGKGTATITAKTSTGKTAKCTVTVTNPITNVTLSKTTLSLIKGETSTLIATINPTDTSDNKTITWTTSNSSVATVSGGKVTAVGVGTATITAKTSNGKTATCQVTVIEKGAYVLGDINKDGSINARDAKLALQYYSGQATLSAEQKLSADVNGDGIINSRDAKLILQYYSGKIDKF